MDLFAEIIVSNTHKDVDRIFHYIIPSALRDEIKIGARVTVPFGRGNKKIEGYVIGFSTETDVPSDKLKEIISVSEDYPVFSEAMLSLAKWMKQKYYTTLSDCIQCILPSGIGTKSLSIKYIYLDTENKDLAQEIQKILAKNDKQSLVVKALMETNGLEYAKIKSNLKISDSPIKTLEKHGIIKIKPFKAFRDTIFNYGITKTEPLKPNYEQQAALDCLYNMLSFNKKKPVLLHGVTGSGKTEIYLQLIDKVLKAGKQAIVLVPEISLTPQTVNRFYSRFGPRVSVTHSRLSSGERFDQWQKAREGYVSVMIGPRSAIFTPFDNLGVIIIDEEHETTYKSETTPKYDVREIAVKLMELTGALVVMGSATPSVETYFGCKCDEIHLIKLNNRVNNVMPDVSIIDMREELALGNKSIFSRALYEAIEETLENKNQAILFINRRGHSTFVSCRVCGNALACDACSINYTYHIYTNKLMCHYCGDEQPMPKNCPICGSIHIKHFGTGTQKVQEEIQKLFPEAKTLRMDMDTTSKKHSHEAILSAFSKGQADILIGTQMIAKGHDFPRVSLVGIIAADISLNTGDFRSAETTYQLLTQVSGRAGRAEIPGKTFIQTYMPEHYSICFAKDNNYDGFYDHEILIRQKMQYPPYTNIFSVMFSGDDEKKVIVALNRLHYIMNFFNKKGNFELLGPSPAQISKINKNFRWRIIVKCVDEEKIKSFVFYCLDKLREREDLSGITINASLNPKILH